MMGRVLQGSPDSKAPEGQWGREDMRVLLGRKVEEEWKEHQAQWDPEGDVWVFTAFDPTYLSIDELLFFPCETIFHCWYVKKVANVSQTESILFPFQGKTGVPGFPGNEGSPVSTLSKKHFLLIIIKCYEIFVLWWTCIQNHFSYI